MKLVIYNNTVEQELLQAIDLDKCILRSNIDYETVDSLILSVNVPITHIAFLYHFPGFFRIPFYYDMSNLNSCETNTEITYKNIENSLFLEKDHSEYNYFSDNLVKLFAHFNVNGLMSKRRLFCPQLGTK